jgi:hypothetical protein
MRLLMLLLNGTASPGPKAPPKSGVQEFEEE